ncbi:MAG TPA: hypothetical protein VKY26_13080, partial [Actinomycetota bacterium]|nr:hypothetical protein [Actinomycetota bacterium]
MKYGVAFPVLPGKESMPEEVGAAIRSRMGEYVESRSSRGVTLERVWLQQNPDGSMLQLVFTEGSGTAEDLVASFRSSTSDFDTWFFDVQQEISGIDFRQPGGGLPENIGSYQAPGGGRNPGYCFCVPVVPGATDVGVAFAKEAYGAKADELAASRAAMGSTREEVFLQRTRMGDLVIVYGEAADPDQANVSFAGS